MPEDVIELKQQIGDYKRMLSDLEALARSVVAIWGLQRDGAFDTDEEILRQLETPIEALERWFTDPPNA